LAEAAEHQQGLGRRSLPALRGGAAAGGGVVHASVNAVNYALPSLCLAAAVQRVAGAMLLAVLAADAADAAGVSKAWHEVLQ